jgi:hypothetical protein
MGCLLGGMAGLLFAAMPVTAFLPWLLGLAAMVFVCSHVQSGTRGVGYIGGQAAVVFIMTIVQGAGPPTSILPGLGRLFGIIGGMAILLIVSLPLREPQPPSRLPSGRAHP